MHRDEAYVEWRARKTEYRAEARDEVLPNFVSRNPEKHTEFDERDADQRVGEDNVSIVRDGDEYLIVGNYGDEAQKDTVWMEREPAVRHAVVPGEQLWKVPDNWTQCLRVHNDDAPDRILYRIPDPEVNVIIRTPRQDESDETRYQVEKIGRATSQLKEEPDCSALQDLISTVEEQDDESDAVLEALQRVEDRWPHFIQSYNGDIERRGSEMMAGMFKSEDKGIVDSWSINPWDTDQDITGSIPNSREIDNDVLSRVASRLIDAGVASPSPSFEVVFEDGKGLPTGYFVQALAEKGCSPAEIVDWMMVNTRGHSQSTWSDVRGEQEQQIAEHIRAADNTLTS